MSNQPSIAMRSWGYGVMFVLLAIAAGAVGCLHPDALIPLGWFAVSWLAVGVAYLRPDADLFRKRSGRLSNVRRVVLAPYVVLQYGLWHIVRRLSPEPAYARLTERILIGRRLLEREYPDLGTLVDCTAEFDEHVPAGVGYIAFPLLDGMAAGVDSLRARAAQVVAAEPPVYIHCAQGHGRTALVAAAALLQSGAARTVEEALDSVKRVRPAARLSGSQLRSLRRAFDRTS